MEFRFETVYDQKALSVMAKGIRKTLRKKKSRRSHIVGWFVIMFGIILSFVPRENGEIFDARSLFTWLVILVMIAALKWEDQINGFFAKQRLLKGTEHAVSVFTKEKFSTATDLGVTEWKYDKICEIAEDSRYFIFVFSQNHAQIYDKNGMSGGTTDEFKAFLEQLTDKKIKNIK